MEAQRGFSGSPSELLEQWAPQAEGQTAKGTSLALDTELGPAAALPEAASFRPGCRRPPRPGTGGGGCWHLDGGGGTRGREAETRARSPPSATETEDEISPNEAQNRLQGVGRWDVLKK